RLVLSRDPIGICPLFVREDDGQIWFGSEVKAIFADLKVPRKINPQGIDQTFTYWASVAPTSVFEGIEELRPGSIRVYENDGSHHDRTFWQPTYSEIDPREQGRPNRLNIEEATEMLREKLLRATQIRMVRADVPVGSYL